jgi:hypothetical protein
MLWEQDLGITVGNGNGEKTTVAGWTLLDRIKRSINLLDVA